MKKKVISLLAAAVLIGAMMGALLWQRSREPEPVADVWTPPEFVQLVQRSEGELVNVEFNWQYRTDVMVPFTDENDRREWMWEGVDYVLVNTDTRHKIRGAFVLFSNNVIHEDIYEAGINLADFGLDPPYLTVTAFYEDGTTTNIFLGSPTIDLSERFVMVEDDNRLHTISRLNADRLMLGLEDLIDRSLPIWDAETIDYLLIAQRGQEVIEFAMEPHHTFDHLDWLVMQQPFPGREVYASAFEYHVFEAFAGFDLGDLVNLHPTNFVAYGLDNPSLEFIYSSFQFGEAHLLFGDVFFREEDGNEVAYIYVKFAGRPHVFEALYEPVSSLFDINVLRFIERFIALVNIQDAERLEVLTPSGDFDIHINHAGDDTTDIAPTINDIFVSEADFRLIYRLLIGLGIDSEIEPFTPRDAPLYTVRYILFEGDDIELRFYHYSDTFLAVSVDGEDVWFVTNRRNFDTFTTRLAEFG